MPCSAKTVVPHGKPNKASRGISGVVVCMKRLASVMLVLFLMLSILILWKPDVPSANAASSIYQGNLILTGNNVTTIQGRFDINGSIIVRGNATLILKNAVVNFTQKAYYEYNMTFENPVNGNPRLLCDNSTLTSSGWFQILFWQNSSATISKSTVHPALLTLEDSAFAALANSSITSVITYNAARSSVVNSDIISRLDIYDSANVVVTNTTIKILFINGYNVNCSLVNVRPGFYSFWDFQTNSSLKIGSGGYAPNVSLTNTTVNYWSFLFASTANATISDSIFDGLWAYSDSTIRLVNTTVSAFQFWSTGKVYVSWYLDVHAIDSTGQNVPSANVTATFPNATVAERKTANSTGWARLTLTEKMVNNTGQYPVGNYSVKAEYGTYSNNISANMTGSKETTIQLSLLVIPEFLVLHALLLIVTMTLVSALFFRRKRFKQKSL